LRIAFWAEAGLRLGPFVLQVPRICSPASSHKLVEIGAPGAFRGTQEAMTWGAARLAGQAGAPLALAGSWRPIGRIRSASSD